MKLYTLYYLMGILGSIVLIGIFAAMGDQLARGTGAAIGICISCLIVVALWRQLYKKNKKKGDYT